MGSTLLKLLIALALALLLTWGYLFIPQSFQSVDSRLRDFLFLVRGELPKSDSVVIVDIDEKSLDKLGQWPWQRDIFANLLYKLTDAGAQVIGLDIVFAEEDRTSPHRFATKFPNLANQLENYDEYLAKCLAQTPVVGGFTFLFHEKSNETHTPNIPAVFMEKGLKNNNEIPVPDGIVLNIPILQNAMQTSGFFNNIPDLGGMITHVPLIMKYDGVIYPSLALEMFRAKMGEQVVKIVGDDIAVDHILIGNYKIPTDLAGRLVLNPRGAQRHFKYISVADIFDDKFDKKDIEGKFVLVGTSAMGLFDLRAIAYDNAIPGVEIHANVIDNILTGDFLHKSADTANYDLIIIWVLTFITVLIFSLINSTLVLPLALLIGYGLFELFYTILFDYGLVLNLLFPAVAFILSIVISLMVDYIVSSRREQEAKRMLGKKVSPAVMNFLLENSKDDLVKSREVEASVFFSDIRSFTTISEKIGSPDRLITMLNEYMTPMVESIINHQGTIDKFIGDAIMAYWNAPLQIENHADMAVRSAIEQIDMLEAINQKITPVYDVTINIGIGVHTGLVTAGDMGAQGRSDYTIIGDNVNLASRLEGLTKQYGANILITKATYEKLTGKYKIRPIDLVEVKGKSQAVEIFEVVCSNKNISDDELKRYEEGIESFREGKVQEAFEIFTELNTKRECILYEMYINRSKYFIDHPKIEFNPILKMTTK
ncbi:MAG: adenylate/guanylate cyclase domain-containing protein [Campylobacterales bacterium]|nr:adenylate/guanylate cyclase domain-containing protein [Campylobacterales bacterium]